MIAGCENLKSTFGDKAMILKKLLVPTFLAILLATISLSAAYPGETYGTVNNVLDAATFDVIIEKSDPRIMSNVEHVRLADIDVPDVSSSEGARARDLTFAVLMNKRVFLDIDDVYGRDPYGRLVCIAYLTGSDGQPLAGPTFNRMLVDAGYAKVRKMTNNEFEPNDRWINQPGASNDIQRWMEKSFQDILGQPPEKIAYELPGMTKQAIDWLAANSPYAYKR